MSHVSCLVGPLVRLHVRSAAPVVLPKYHGEGIGDVVGSPNPTLRNKYGKDMWPLEKKGQEVWVNATSLVADQKDGGLGRGVGSQARL